MKQFIDQLQRRNVIRAGTAYAVVAWVALQFAAVVLPPLGIANWVLSMVIVLAVAGFPLSLIFAWTHEWTSEGLKTHAAAEELGLTKDPGFGRLIDFVIIALLLFAVGWMIFVTGSAKLETEQKQAQTEEMIRFMIEQIGDSQDYRANLRILDSIGSEILNYYGSLDPKKMGGESLALRSRAFRMIGGIENTRGDFDLAEDHFVTAYSTTAELLDREPANTQRIYDHIQSSFFIGELAWRRGDYATAETYFMAYRDLANQLVAFENGNLDWHGEVGFANSNLGTLYLKQGAFLKAIDAFSRAHAKFEKIVAFSVNPEFWRRQLSQTHAWLADAHVQSGNLATALTHRMEQHSIYMNILANDPGDIEIMADLMVNYRALAELSLYQGHIDEARSYLETALPISDTLLTFESENTVWRARVGALLLDYAEVHIHAKNMDAAAHWLGQAEDVFSPLIDPETTILSWKVNLQNRFQLLKSQLLVYTGDRIKSLQVAEQAVANLEALHRANSTDHDIIQFLCIGAFLVGDNHAALGQSAKAREAWKRITELVSIETQGLSLRTRETLAKTYARLGEDEAASEVGLYLEEIGYSYPGYVSFQE